ncbi:Lipase, partial [Operophtera brumata]
MLKFSILLFAVVAEILKYRDANVIIVDWSASSKLSYSNAAGAVPGVGRLLAEFLITLESQKEIVEDDYVDDISDNPLYYDNAIKSDVKTVASRIESQGIGRIQFSNLHLVGFNLGAHVVGHAAREITLRTGARVARITGLDPSRSQWGSGSSRLARTDATYVEVIHTDGDGLLSNGLGTAIGDVDFFVNGGSNQPG